MRRFVFAGAVALCLVHPAIALFVELPRTPVVRGVASATLRSIYRPAYLDQIRAQASNGDLFLDFELPASARELAALIYYQCTYELYPRRVWVTDEPAVINDGRDLLRLARVPDPGWLAAQGLKWRVRLAQKGGRLEFDVRPVPQP